MTQLRARLFSSSLPALCPVPNGVTAPSTLPTSLFNKVGHIMSKAAKTACWFIWQDLFYSNSFLGVRGAGSHYAALTGILHISVDLSCVPCPVKCLWCVFCLWSIKDRNEGAFVFLQRTQIQTPAPTWWPITPLPGDLTPSDLSEHQASLWHRQTSRQHIYTHKIKFKTSEMYSFYTHFHSTFIWKHISFLIFAFTIWF